jgi:hypothetical protein
MTVVAVTTDAPGGDSAECPTGRFTVWRARARRPQMLCSRWHQEKFGDARREGAVFRRSRRTGTQCLPESGESNSQLPSHRIAAQVLRMRHDGIIRRTRPVFLLDEMRRAKTLPRSPQRFSIFSRSPGICERR